MLLREPYVEIVFDKVLIYVFNLSGSLSNPRVQSNLSSVRLNFPKSCDFFFAVNGWNYSFW